MSHTITITEMPNDDVDDHEWEIGGTCDRYCRLWGPAEGGPGKEANTADDQIIDGVRWSWIEGEWMHQIDFCAFDEQADSISEALVDLGDAVHIGGTYKIDGDYEGDGCWIFNIDPHEEAADHEH